MVQAFQKKASIDLNKEITSSTSLGPLDKQTFAWTLHIILIIAIIDTDILWFIARV